MKNMIETGIFYGTSSGNTKAIAEMILGKLGEDNAHLHNVKDSEAYDLQKYRYLILGIPTWSGGLMPKDWRNFVEELEHAFISNKKIALFGVGDQESYPENFVDAMGDLYKLLKKKGCKVVGEWPVEGYNYDSSSAVVDGKFVGLVLDEDNQSTETVNRLDKWINQIKKEFKA